MYSVMLAAMLTAGTATPEFCFGHCGGGHGCWGSCGGCYSSCGGCYGCGGCWGGYSGCYGGCHGCYGGCHGCWGGCQGGCYAYSVCGGCSRGCSGCSSYCTGGYWGTGCHGSCGGCYSACHGGCYGGCHGSCCGGVAVVCTGVVTCGGYATAVPSCAGRVVASTAAPVATAAAPQTDSHARVTVKVPEDARLWVDDVSCPLTSGQRTFKTPELESGKAYYYSVKAAVVRDGRVLSDTRRVVVQAGKEAVVDFTDLVPPVQTAQASR